MIECETWEELPIAVSNLLSLEVIDFRGCRALKMTPDSHGNLTDVKILRMIEGEALKICMLE